jgi:hypothetical protein
MDGVFGAARSDLEWERLQQSGAGIDDHDATYGRGRGWQRNGWRERPGQRGQARAGRCERHSRLERCPDRHGDCGCQCQAVDLT